MSPGMHKVIGPHCFVPTEVFPWFQRTGDCSTFLGSHVSPGEGEDGSAVGVYGPEQSVNFSVDDRAQQERAR
jgi:hypothetical protein